MKAKDLVKVLNREKGAEILIDNHPISGFHITFSCNEKGKWVINFVPNYAAEDEKKS